MILLIKDFLKWWNHSSDGHRYMTMFECAYHDPIIWSLGATSITIFLCYLYVAYNHFQISKRYPDSNTKKYLQNFTLVFIFCSTHYALRFVGLFWNSYKLELLLQAILLLVTLWFISSTTKSRTFQKMFEDEQDWKSKLAILKLELQKRIARDFSSEETTLIRYYDLKHNVNEGENIYVNAGVHYRAVDLSGEILHYKTYIKAGWYFGGQKHDCFEMCIPWKGILKFSPNSEIQAGVGEKLLFDVLVAHNPGSEEDTEIDVYFSNFPFK